MSEWRCRQAVPEWINFYEKIPSSVAHSTTHRNPNRDQHGIEHPLNAVICGSTGLGNQVKSGGKTTALLNLINAMNCFDKIFVFARNPEEPLYKYLKWAAERHASQYGGQGAGMVQISNSLEELPSIDELNPREQSMYVFDDVVSQPKDVQKQIFEFFLRGRKSNCSSV